MSETIARRGALRLGAARAHADVHVACAVTPLVAVLCAPRRARACAAAVALALAGAAGRTPALTAAVGVVQPSAPGGGTPAARRVAVLLRARGLPAAAAGRLVWIADPLGREGGDAERDEAGLAAAAAAALGRAAAAAAVPAALALPLSRTAALDRVLAWHDGIVVVREPDDGGALFERALTSIAALGRPVAAMAPPRRVAAPLASGGLCAPVDAVRAVEQLGLGGRRDA